VVAAYVDWFRDLPVQLWLTVNAAEPLGAGSWRFVLHRVHELSGLDGLWRCRWR
jgi:hypothetical protein